MYTDDQLPEQPGDVANTVSRALAEDVGHGDLTAALLPAGLDARATLISREHAVLCGSPWLEEVFRQLDASITVSWDAADGMAIAAGSRICTIDGPAAAILTGERVALNFLQCLSATATLARQYAEAVHGTGARVLDTRKTLPGLRTAQKYAVRVGGCYNHRMGLYDAVLIKENHVMAAGSIGAAVRASRQRHPGVSVEVEVEDLAELKEALVAGADIVLLDNFDLAAVREAVAASAGRAKLEVSGGVDIESVRALAETGVDYISVGALTKNIRAVDLSLRFEPLAT